jgi:hypothetical protein
VFQLKDPVIVAVQYFPPAAKHRVFLKGSSTRNALNVPTMYLSPISVDAMFPILQMEKAFVLASWFHRFQKNKI